MRIEELEALYEKATKGEWKARCFSAGNSIVDAGYWTAYLETNGGPTSVERADSAEFIAAAHNQFLALVARLRALEAVAEAAMDWKKSHDWAAQNPGKMLSSSMTSKEAAEVMREYFGKEKALKSALSSLSAMSGGGK